MRGCRCRVLFGSHLLQAVSPGPEYPQRPGETPLAEAQVLVRLLARSEALGKAGGASGLLASRGPARRSQRRWKKAEPKECTSRRSLEPPPEAGLS